MRNRRSLQLNRVYTSLHFCLLHPLKHWLSIVFFASVNPSSHASYIIYDRCVCCFKNPGVVAAARVLPLAPAFGVRIYPPGVGYVQKCSKHCYVEQAFKFRRNVTYGNPGFQTGVLMVKDMESLRDGLYGPMFRTVWVMPAPR